MHYFKKIKKLWLAIGLMLIVSNIVHAESQSHLLIKQASLVRQSGQYFLQAQLDVEFSDAIKQALLKGFTLHFILEFQLSKPIKYWFNDEIVTKARHIELSYLPLSRQYVLKQNRQNEYFTSLNAVEQALNKLKDSRMFNAKVVADEDVDAQYQAVALFRLDYKKLPKALQEQAKDSSAWQMTSQRFKWKPVLIE